MKVENRTGHSVFLSDLNVSFCPVEECGAIEITHQDLLKSMSLRNIIRHGAFVPTEWNKENKLESSLSKESHTSVSNAKSTKPNEKDGIVLRGQFLDYSGYAKVNRNLASCMVENGIKVCINAVDSSTPRLIGADLTLSSNFSYTNASVGDIIIDSIVPSTDVARGRRKTILYTTVESYSIPSSFSAIFDKYDEIWTTSNFCKSVIEDKTSKQVIVVPGIVDFLNYKEDGDRFDLAGQAKSFKFISVFNWNYRKGADALIRAYCKAFSGSDDVSLILVCRKKRISGPASGVRDEIEKEIAKSSSSSPPHVMRVTKEINEIQLAELYRSCNAFVLPSRGEGYGLPYLEASLCGLPVIGTKVSAIKDILSSDNSLLVDIDSIKKVPSNATGCYFWDGHLMADLTSNAFIDRLADSMKDMIKNYQLYVEKNKVLKRNTCNNSSSEAVFNIIKDKIH